MRILAITNMYPRRRFPVRASLCMNRSRACANGLDVRVLFADRRRYGPMAYHAGFNGRSPGRPAGFEPDAITSCMADHGGPDRRRQHFRPVVVTFHGSDLLGGNLSGWMRRIISRYGVYCSRRAARRRRGRGGVARHLAMPGRPPRRGSSRDSLWH